MWSKKGYVLGQQHKKRRIIEYDLIRVVSIVAVIAIHCVAFINSKHPPFAETWQAATLVNSFSRWSVPVFIMLSGALLIKPQDSLEGIKKFYSSKVARILTPLVAWGLIYLAWYAVFQSTKPLNQDIIYGVERFIVGDPVSGHLYFLIVIMGLYLMTPLLNILVSRISLNAILKISIILLVAASLSHTIQLWITGMNGKSIITLWLPYTGYYLLGYVLGVKREDIKNRLKSRWLIAAGLLCGVTIATVTYLLKSAHILQYNYLYGYHSPVVIIFAIVVFAMLLKLSDWIMKNKSSISRIGMNYEDLIVKLSALTFSVYLVHRLLIFFLWEVFEDYINGSNDFIIAMVTFLIVVPVSYLLVYLYNQIASYSLNKFARVNS